MRCVAIAFAVAATMLAGGVVSGDPVYRHSGTIISTSRDALVLAEVGPWKVANGATVVTERRIVVTDATTFVEVQRTNHSESGFPGDYTEDPLIWDLAPGAFVTVECQHRGATMIALKVVFVSFLEP